MSCDKEMQDYIYKLQTEPPKPPPKIPMRVTLSRQQWNALPVESAVRELGEETTPPLCRVKFRGLWWLFGHENSPAVIRIGRPLRKGEKPDYKNSSLSPELDRMLRRKR